MVTFKNVGRMGNFLFQAATTMAYAWKHGLEFTVPSVTKDPKWNPLYLQHLVNPKWDPTRPIYTIKEQKFSYSELPYGGMRFSDKHNIVLDGYWQSEKYFKEYRKRIIENMKLFDDVNPWDVEVVGQNVVSVHVRRTDYLTLTKKHPPVTKEWYEKAMGLFPSHRFLFFSDDIDWCMKTFGHRDDCDFSGGKTETRDLVLMTRCTHHICSASTFSWWGAWLNENPNKRVIIPKQWFMPGRPEDTRDIVPPEWEKL